MREPPPPPATPRAPVTDVLHGVPITDPYRWLEDADSPAVQAWTTAQGEYARDALASAPGRPALRARLQSLLSIGALTPPSVRRGSYFYERRSGAQEQPVLYRRGALRGADVPLLDPAALGGDATSALDWYYPSPDGGLVAYGLSDQGSENSTLRVREVRSGRDLTDVIPSTRACSLEWWPDGRGFVYTRYPEPGSVPPGEESYHRRVFDHALGRGWREDPLLFGGERAPEDWPSVHLSPGGRWLAVSVSRGWTRTDVYLSDRSRGGPFVPVVAGEDAVFGVILRDERLFLHTNLDAPRFRLMEVDPERPERSRWREVIPEGNDVLEAVALVGTTFLAQWLRDCSSRVSLHGADGARLGEVPLPQIGSVGGLSGEWDGAEAFFGFSSYAVPPAVYRVPLPSGSPELWERVEAEIDPSAYAVRFVRTASRDGTPISLFLVHARERPSDGSGPAVLTGYGGFSVSHAPAFARSVIPFLEGGGLYAVAHLRGGGEYGEEWHRAGMLDRKQNTFDDFIAAAEFLVAEGHAAPGRLGILGGSNGGLLVGAALTQRPELFAAAVAQVPLMDMIRYHRFRIARLWIPEYGSPEDQEAFRWLLAYSPYHRVEEGRPYPAVLLTAGESDSRVDAMHARKMAARLQASSSSGRRVLLRVDGRAGHGQGKPRSKVLEEWTDLWTFLVHELGVEPPLLRPTQA